MPDRLFLGNRDYTLLDGAWSARTWRPEPWVIDNASRTARQDHRTYDAPDCETGGGAPYLLADANALMRNGIVVEGKLGFTAPTLVYPADPVQAVVIKSRLLMSFNGTVLC